MCLESHLSQPHKHSLRNLCCFRPHTHRVLHNEEDNNSPPSTTTHDVFCAKYRSCGVIGRLMRCQNQIGGSVDYSYNPVSYALNFESDNKGDDEVLVHSFAARLPASPLRHSKDVKGIAVHS